jgi:hypothetical protein
MLRRIPPVGGGGSGPTANAALYSTGAPAGGLGAYGAPASGVVNQKKPVPRGVRPSFPLVTNDPGPQVPPPKPMMVGMPIWGGNRPTTTDANGRPFTGMGNDVMYPGGRPPVQNRLPNPRLPDESGFLYRPQGAGPGAQPATPFQGFGNDVMRGSNGLPIGGFGWDPLMMDEEGGRGGRGRGQINSRDMIRAGSASGRPQGAQLANNTAPNYNGSRAGTQYFEVGGQWWRDPNKAVSNAGGWWNDPSGAGQDLNRYMSGLTPYGTPLGTGPGGAPLGDNGPPMTAQMRGSKSGGSRRGMAGYGGGVQDFIDATNEANKRNAKRQNNVTSGYEAMKNWITGLVGNMGEMQRKDINTTFDKEKGRLTQDMISRGLTASTVLDNMQKGNERTRGEALARLDDGLTEKMLGHVTPVWGKQLDFLTGVEENGPNLAMMAQLLQQANSAGGMNGYQGGGNGGGGGGRGFGAGIPVSIDSGSIGYQMPGGMGFGGGNWIQGGGTTIPYMQALDNRLANLRRNQNRLNYSPTGPITYSPSSMPGGLLGPGAGMGDSFDPSMYWA